VALGTVSALRPLVNVTIGFVSGVAIALLKLAAELLSLAGDGRQVIIGELPPFLFDFRLSVASNFLQCDPNSSSAPFSKRCSQAEQSKCQSERSELDAKHLTNFYS